MTEFRNYGGISRQYFNLWVTQIHKHQDLSNVVVDTKTAVPLISAHDVLTSTAVYTSETHPKHKNRRFPTSHSLEQSQDMSVLYSQGVIPKPKDATV